MALIKNILCDKVDFCLIINTYKFDNNDLGRCY